MFWFRLNLHLLTPARRWVYNWKISFYLLFTIYSNKIHTLLSLLHWAMHHPCNDMTVDFLNESPWALFINSALLTFKSILSGSVNDRINFYPGSVFIPSFQILRCKEIRRKATRFLISFGRFLVSMLSSEEAVKN